MNAECGCMNHDDFRDICIVCGKGPVADPGYCPRIEGYLCREHLDKWLPTKWNHVNLIWEAHCDWSKASAERKETRVRPGLIA